MTACGHNPPIPPDTVQTRSKTELGVATLPIDLLRKCQGLPDSTGIPPNNIGALLADGTEAMTLLAECMKRQHALIDLVRPLAYDERNRK